MKRILSFPIFLVSLALLLFSFSGEQEPIRKSYAETISAADLKKHLSILASDEYEGRETAKKGQKMAAEYISAQFRAMGIPELPTGGYLQNVPLLQFGGAAGEVKTPQAKFVVGSDFYYTTGTDNQHLLADQIVFAGYGIQDSIFQDYDKLDVKGKAVMIIADEPLNKKGNSIISGNSELSAWSTNRRKKINEAKNRNAKALLIVVPDYAKRFASSKKYIYSPTLSLDEPNEKKEDPSMPVLYISKEMANAILAEGKQKRNIDKISAHIAQKKKSVRFEFTQALDISVNRPSEKVSSENVLGYLEGSDLKNELVVITAHYDHLGKDSTMIFNGADDDGSGTVSVLELAEAFVKAKKEGHGPRRSILFMTVTGEEKGLLGSKWYTNHPVFPLSSTVVDLNIDMIGRIDPAHKSDTNYVYVIGSDKLSTDLKKINENNNAIYTKLLLDYKYDDPNDPNNFYGRSDHYNFAKHDIPIAFFFNGTHVDYHKETDEVSKINFPLMELRARLVFYDAWEIANRDQRLVVDGKTNK